MWKARMTKQLPNLQAIKTENYQLNNQTRIQKNYGEALNQNSKLVSGFPIKKVLNPTASFPTCNYTLKQPKGVGRLGLRLRNLLPPWIRRSKVRISRESRTRGMSRDCFGHKNKKRTHRNLLLKSTLFLIKDSVRRDFSKQKMLRVSNRILVALRGSGAQT